MFHFNNIFEIKPISVNDAWRGGKRFRTKEYLEFENAAVLMMRTTLQRTASKDLEVWIKIYHPTPNIFDVDNYAKVILDCLVKSGAILDDRYITRLHLEKIKADKDAFGLEIVDLSA